MGMDLDLYVNDNSIESPYLSRSFKNEIIFDWYLSFESFLSKEEIKTIMPNTYGEISIGEKKNFNKEVKSVALNKLSDAINDKESLTKINDFFNDYLIISEKVEDRERNPQALKDVLQKVENELITKRAQFPLVHSIYKGVHLILSPYIKSY